MAAHIGPLPEEWKPRIRAAYGDLQPLRVRVNTAETTAGGTAASASVPSAELVYDAVTSTARAMPQWEVMAVDLAKGAAGADAGVIPRLVLEAVSTTRLLKFKDDVCVSPMQSEV